MINRNSIEAVRSSRFSSRFTKPLYNTYCFSQIPHSIEGLLFGEELGLPDDVFQTDKEFDHVVLCFLDAFGWHFFEKYRDSLPFFRETEGEGRFTKLTSMFPSTTTAHVTCINTGLTPNQSGLYEWFILEPSINEIITPLLSSFAGEKTTGTLLKTNLDLREVYPQNTLYQHLTSLGVNCHTYQPGSFSHSPYSLAVLNGSTIHGYSSPSHAFEEMPKHMRGKSYSYFYFADIDSIGHRHGVYTEPFFNAIEKIFQEITTLYAKLPPKTALLITADHGMTALDPKSTYYLNRQVPSIEKYLKKNARGRPLAPAGSCRDMFLHAREDSVTELKEVLEQFIEGRGEVYQTKDLIEAQLFGPNPPSQRFLNRVGNLAILSHSGEGIWWYERGKFEQNFYAAHGGMTKEEMEIPLLFFQT